jgi:hypothetical protein
MKFPLISLYRALLALIGLILMILGVLAVLIGFGFGIGVYAGFVMIASAIPFFS